MTLFSSRLLLLPLTLALAHCGGGGGGEAVAAPTTPPAATDPYAGTAYQKLEVTTLAKGGGPGLARSTTQGLVDQCNLERKARYELPPVQPDVALMAGLDVKTLERFYDNRKAGELTTGYGLRLTDYQRWTNELRSGTGANPATPPDCSVVQKEEAFSGYLWLDDIRYELRFATKQALGRRSHLSFTPTDLATSSQVAAWPAKTVMGESCRVASTPADPSLDGACLWERFPARKYLNLPWALESVTGAVQEVRVVTLALERDKPLRAGVLAIPEGFTAQVD
ncbi:hypothetical protein [Roseateles sp. LKC17W]|uniref:Lipoprotein n=1 Tax=Pelomonas margarita TaxID=3299031 RepID=A0ABW7FLK1_9BURK